MLLLDGPLTFREYMANEPIPLATVFRVVFDFLAARHDAVLFGAQAVNAYCDPPRMTEDVDVFSTDAVGLAEELRVHLGDHFHVAMRVREVKEGGLRVFQLKNPRRHLVDVRQVAALPKKKTIHGVFVVVPDELTALKLLGLASRLGQAKEFTDRADLQRMLERFPALKDDGRVEKILLRMGATGRTLGLWDEVRHRQMVPPKDEGW